MRKFEGFRADRLAEVMKEYEVSEKELAKTLGTKNVWLLNRILHSYMFDYTNKVLFLICETCNCTSDYLLGLSDNIN